MKGSHTVDLSKTGASGTDVDVYRNNVFRATAPTASNGSCTDNINKKGGATYTHKVCDAGTTTCSTETITVF